MKYKTEIKNGFSSVYVSIADQNNNWVCNLNFNKDYIQNMDSIYYGNEKKQYISEADTLDKEMTTILSRVQRELDLDKYNFITS